MSYNYEIQKPQIFTEEGQVLFLKIRDTKDRLLKEAGACRMQELWKDCTGNTDDMLASVDRLVELGELIEVELPYPAPGQHRVFIGRRKVRV